MGPFPLPGDLPDPGIEPGSPALQADSLLSEQLGKSMKPQTEHKERVQCSEHLFTHLEGFNLGSTEGLLQALAKSWTT